MRKFDVLRFSQNPLIPCLSGLTLQWGLVLGKISGNDQAAPKNVAHIKSGQKCNKNICFATF